MRLLLVRVLCLLCAPGLLGGCAASGPSLSGGAAAPPLAPVSHVDRSDRSVGRALAVLHRWDGRRAAAYASGDAGVLRRLYVRGSVAGARDVAILQEYAARGLGVKDLSMQVLDAEVLEGSPTRLRVHLVDRVAGATAIVERSEVALPGGRPRSRTVTLVRSGGRWLVRSVRPGSVDVSAAPR